MLIFPKISKIAFSIGFFHVHWYGLAYLFGILIALFLTQEKINKNHEIFQTKEIFEKFFLYLVLVLAFGGRLGYVFFYNPTYYFQNWIEIFMPWKGGMAFHGAFFGMAIFIYFFSKIYKINFLKLTDLVCFVCMPGIFLGRIANFVNRELLGTFSNSEIPWLVLFPGEVLPRHPSQIYEAILEGFLPFCIIFFLNKKFLFFENKKNEGFLTIFFLIFYGISRFFIEKFFRLPDPNLGLFFLSKFTMGQFFCFIMFCIGILIIFYKKYDRSL